MSKLSPLIGLTTYRVKVEGRDVTVDGLMSPYAKAVSAAGGIPVLIPLSLSEAELNELRRRLDGIILPGGGDMDPIHYGGDSNGKIYGVTPDRDRVELHLAKEAVDKDQPLFAICRGHQVLNVALGGTLYEDVLDMMPGAIKHAYFTDAPRDYHAHPVEIKADTKLSELLNEKTEIGVNSLHHQGIKDLGTYLLPNAYSPDGLVEGYEIPGHRFAMSVQWHPEELVHRDEDMRILFKAFIDACR
ncbi:MAG: gamma-glutamyl-gamma-aminobutyrate hydrolase family protein [Chloroflexota bacterium]